MDILKMLEQTRRNNAKTSGFSTAEEREQLTAEFDKTRELKYDENGEVVAVDKSTGKVVDRIVTTERR